MCLIRLEFTTEPIIVLACLPFETLIAASIVIVEAAIVLVVAVCKIGLVRNDEFEFVIACGGT